MIKSDDYVKQIIGRIESLNIFPFDNVLEVYDPEILQEIASKLDYPVCGVVYEGISTGALHGTGLYVGVFVLLDSRSRDVRRKADHGSIAGILDAIRSAIEGCPSIGGSEWNFIMEIPVDLKDRGLVYYQRWGTRVVI